MPRLTRFLPAQSSPFRFTPRMEVLDDRIVPSFLTTIGSTKTDGSQGTATANLSAISGDGRFVAFLTTSQLVADDTNGLNDVYLKDRMTGTVTLVSRADGLAGAAGTGGAPLYTPSVSADGRYVAFDSSATNLVAGDANATYDVFVRDVVAGTTTLVSRADGAAGAQGNAFAGLAHISADGKFVTYASSATNLVAGDTNASYDIFVRDLTALTTTRANTDSAGTQASAGSSAFASNVSGDGRYVVFSSTATNLVLNDTNAVGDVFVKDRVTGTTTRVSVASDGTQGNAASGFTGATFRGLGISNDGKFVVYQSDATNLVANDTNATTDVFLRDITAGTTTRMSTDATGIQGNAASVDPTISGNGRFVAFTSLAGNLVTGDTNALNDVFVKDRIGGAIVRVSVAADGTQSNGTSQNAAISRDGQFTAFDSGASNLASPDANGVFDVFVNRRPLPALFSAAPAAGGSSQIRVFNPDGTQKFSFFAYPAGYTGGAFVSLGDVNGDGVDDIVTSTGPGGSANIRVFDGVTGSLFASFFAYPEGFTGGVNVAVADVNNDGYADIICGVGVGGGPNIRILDGKQVTLGNFSLAPTTSGGALVASFFAYPEAFTGGVRVAAGDVNGDGFADVIAGVGSGGGPNVRVFDGRQLGLQNFSLGLTTAGGALINSFFALPSTFTGGLFVSAGDVNNDGFADVIAGVESGGGPNVRAFNASTSAQLQSFFAFDAALTGGVRVASTDLNGDGFDDFVTGTGPGTGSLLRIFSGKDGSTQLLPQFAPFGGFAGGVNVG